MPNEKCPHSVGAPCMKPVGSDCVRPTIGVCDNLVAFEGNFLFAHATLYCKLRNAIGNKPKVSATPNACYVAAKSICDDVYRYSAYHLGDLKSKTANSVKMAAYSCKWIPRLRILEYENTIPESGQNPDDISGLTNNVEFALLISQAYIASELQREFSFKNHYYAEFVYDLFYRELNADGLLHIYQNIHSAVKAGQAGILEFP